MSQNWSFLFGRDEHKKCFKPSPCGMSNLLQMLSIQMQVLLTRKGFSPHLSKQNSPCLHDAGPRPIDHPMSPVFGVSVWWCWLMEIPKNVIISTSWDSRNVMILYILFIYIHLICRPVACMKCSHLVMTKLKKKHVSTWSCSSCSSYLGVEQLWKPNQRVLQMRWTPKV